jgi:hypothetical protein
MSRIASAGLGLLTATFAPPLVAQTVTPFPLGPTRPLSERFEKAPVPDLTMYADGVVIEDFDGDGLDDIVVASLLASGVDAFGCRYYRNLGSELFADVTATQTEGSPTSIGPCVIADIDGDGDPDVVGPERILRNDGGFLRVEPLPSAMFQRDCVAAGDLDGDGDVDLMIGVGFGGGPSRQDRVMLNDGTGTFAFAPATALPVDNDNTQDIQLFDADGDGDLDAVLGIERATTQTGGARLYLNDGTGTFSDASANFPMPLEDALSISAHDFDQDGDVDVIIGTGSGFGIQAPEDRFLRNDGQGVFTLDATMLPAIAESASDVEAADIDNDGDLDLLVAHGTRTNELQRVYRNDLTSFADVSSTWLPPELLRSGHWATGDFDGDGYVDAALATGGFSTGQQGRLRVFHNQTGASLLLLNPSRLQPVSYSGSVVHDAGTFADIDGDGDLDFFEPIGDGSSFPVPQRLLRNDGHARMTDVSATRLPELVSAYTAQFVDIDIDGDQDLVLGTYSGFALWLNDGSGNFTLPPAGTIPAQTTRIASLAIGDVDNDGDLDIFGGREAFSTFDELLRNDGSGAFTRDPAALPTHSSSGIPSCAMLDYDDDGDLDILVALSTGFNGTLQAYENDGTGNFSVAAGVLPSVSSARRITPFDADGDADLDLLVGSGSSLTALRDVGPSFVSSGLQLQGLLSGADDATVFDYEGDGDTDLIVTRFGERVVLVRQPNQQFRELDVGLFAGGASNTPGADLDGDGDADFLRQAPFETRSLRCGNRLQLHAPWLARVGKPYRVLLRYRPQELGQLRFAWFLTNTSRLTPGAQLPFGTLVVDPTGAIVGIGATQTQPDSDVAWGLQCDLNLPANPTLVGSTLYSQVIYSCALAFGISNTIPDEIH